MKPLPLAVKLFSTITGFERCWKAYLVICDQSKSNYCPLFQVFILSTARVCSFAQQRQTDSNYKHITLTGHFIKYTLVVKGWTPFCLQN